MIDIWNYMEHQLLIEITHSTFFQIHFNFIQLMNACVCCMLQDKIIYKLLFQILLPGMTCFITEGVEVIRRWGGAGDMSRIIWEEQEEEIWCCQQILTWFTTPGHHHLSSRHMETEDKKWSCFCWHSLMCYDRCVRVSGAGDIQWRYIRSKHPVNRT